MKQTLFGYLVLLFIAFSLINTPTCSSIASSSSVQQYTLYNKRIYIDGDAAFHTQAAAEGWDVGGRDGTPSKPYLITGLNITNSSAAITIRETTVFFEISDNYIISTDSHGFYLYNVENGNISNNIITNCASAGIYLNRGSNNIIHGNTISNGGFYYIAAFLDNCGIYLSSATNNIVSNNIITDYDPFNGIGIRIAYAANNTIIDNVLTRNGFFFTGSVPIAKAGISVNTIIQTAVTGNTVDGRPFIFWYNESDQTVPTNAAQVCLINCTSITASDLVLSNVPTGILVKNGSHLSIQNSVITNTSLNALHMTYSSDNTIFQNTMANNSGASLGVYFSENTTISYNTISNNTEFGIVLDSWNNTLTHNTVLDNLYGIDFDGYNNTLTANTFSDNNKSGIFIYSSSFCVNNTITNNFIQHNGEDGINSDFTNFPRNFNNFSNNYISHNGHDGIYLASYENNTLINNTVTENGHGIHLYKSSNNTLFNNNISHNNLNGLYLVEAHDNTFVDNPISNNGEYGINLVQSHHNFLSANVILQNLNNGIDLDLSDNNTIQANTISQNMVGVHLNQSMNGIILGNTVSNNYDSGFILLDSTSASLQGNTADNNNQFGIYLENATTCNLTNNHVVSNTIYGLFLKQSDFNSVFNNTIYENTIYGIYIDDSSDNNTITGNTITDNNNYGVHLLDSENNTISWNNFIGNNPTGSSQAYSTLSAYSTFDHNYWADWITPDANNDGIVDDEYVIDGSSNNRDYYPLVTPVFTSHHSITIPVIIFPNGGEVVTDLILGTWMVSIDSLGHDITYDIYFSANAGGLWSLFASNLTTTNHTIDTNLLVDGTSYLMKVVAEDSEGFTAEDVSDSVFTIRNTPHTLSIPTVITPNGGETLDGSVAIQWTAAIDSWDHNVTYSVHYSSNNGADWTLLISDLTVTTYLWNTATVSDGIAYRIKIVATCSEELAEEDISDNVFTIQNTPTTSSIPSTTTSTPSPTTTTPTTSEETSATKKPSSFPGFEMVVMFSGIIAIVLIKRKRTR